MPVAILVRQILRINADDTVAVVAAVGKHGLVALDAIRMLIAQHVALARQRLIALPAAKMTQVPILGHGFRVFSTENQRIKMFVSTVVDFPLYDQ